MGCPLIFNNWGGTMPQEELAPRYFEKRGLSSAIQTPGDLPRLVGRWLENPQEYQALRRRYREHRLEADPARILDAVLGTPGSP